MGQVWIMTAWYGRIPLAIGLMIWPTLAYEVSVSELPRPSITLRGFPLPWNGDALLGSGPPTDIFILPASIDLVVWLVLAAALWKQLIPYLRSIRSALRISVVTFVWLYAGAGLLFLAPRLFVFPGSMKLWYDSDLYGPLIAVEVIMW